MISKQLLIIVYLFLVFIISMYCFRRPDYNWDILPYMALVIKEENGTTDVHKETYRIARQEVPAEKYRLLTDSSNFYRREMNNEAGAFYKQFPFYNVKQGYIIVCKLCYKLGISLTKATVIPSILGFIGIAFLLFFWLSKFLTPVKCFVISSLVILSPPLLEVARLSTPDSLAAFLFLLSLYLIVQKKSIAGGYVLMIAAICTRLDLAITSMLVVAIIYYKKLVGLKELIAMVAGLIVCYLLVSYSVVKYDWSIFYYPSFSRHLALFGETGGSMNSYFDLVKSQLFTGLFYSQVVLFMLMHFMAYMKDKEMTKTGYSLEQLIGLAFLIAIGIRFILHPVISDRFYIPYYVFILLLLAKSVFSKPVKQNYH